MFACQCTDLIFSQNGRGIVENGSASARQRVIGRIRQLSYGVGGGGQTAKDRNTCGDRTAFREVMIVEGWGRLVVKGLFIFWREERCGLDWQIASSDDSTP